MKYSLKASHSFLPIVFILLSLLSVVVFAQTQSFVKLEAEDGSLSGNASVNNSATASGGSFVSFNAPTPPPPTGQLDSILRPPAGRLLTGVQQEASGYTGWLAEVGEAPHIFHRYSTSGSSFVSALNSTPNGMIPLVNFKPTGGMGLSTYNGILAGAGNSAIDQAADAIIAYGKPMFLAPMHEPENDDDGPGDDEYAAAFRYIVERVRARGADNAVIVWNMMGYHGHGTRYNTLYPGDDVVDWIGADPYIQTSTTIDTWNELINQTSAGFPGFYNWAAPKGKPMMFCEWGIGPTIVPATPNKMFGNTEMANLTNNLPLLKALVYWNQEGLADYRVSHPNWTDGILTTWVNRPEFQVDISSVAK